MARILCNFTFQFLFTGHKQYLMINLHCKHSSNSQSKAVTEGISSNANSYSTVII